MLLEIMPYVVGAAVSPVALAICVLFLASPRKPLQQAVAFAVGGIVSGAVAGSFVFFAVHTRAQSARPTFTDAAIHVFLGLVLLVMAIRIWRKPQKTTKKVSKKTHYSRAFLLGLGMVATDFTSLIMFIPASLALQTASADVRLTGLVLLIVALTSALWLPILVVLLLGETGKRLLAIASKFMTKHGHEVSGGMVGLIALYVLYKGISGL
jgi:threonine/homoserine/homoserine lactone efflux protein